MYKIGKIFFTILFIFMLLYVFVSPMPDYFHAFSRSISISEYNAKDFILQACFIVPIAGLYLLWGQKHF
jgi:hypothetical protein